MKHPRVSLPHNAPSTRDWSEYGRDGLPTGRTLHVVQTTPLPRSDPALRALLMSARAGVVTHRGHSYALTWWED